MFRHGDEAPDQQTTWSEDQVRELVHVILETPQGKALLAKALLEHLAEHEPIKERIGEIAVAAVDAFLLQAMKEAEAESKGSYFESSQGESLGVDCG